MASLQQQKCREECGSVTPGHVLQFMFCSIICIFASLEWHELRLWLPSSPGYYMWSPSMMLPQWLCPRLPLSHNSLPIRLSCRDRYTIGVGGMLEPFEWFSNCFIVVIIPMSNDGRSGAACCNGYAVISQHAGSDRDVFLNSAPVVAIRCSAATFIRLQDPVCPIRQPRPPLAVCILLEHLHQASTKLVAITVSHRARV